MVKMEPQNGEINRLPPEIISKIFSYLPALDWKQARLVCTRWYEASKDPSLLKYHKFVFYSLIYDNQVNLIFDTLDSADFNYYNLEFSDLTLNDEFETFIETYGSMVFSLVLDSCWFSFKTLEKIMISCVNLKELRFMGCTYYSEITPCIPTINEVAVVCRSLRALDISDCKWMSDLLFTVFINVYPNVRKIVLEKLNLDYDRKNFDTRYKNANDYSPSDSIFTFYHFYQTISKRCEMTEYLSLEISDNSYGSLSDDDFALLATCPTIRLTGINLSGHDKISSKGFKYFLANQKNITCLDVSNCRNFDFKCYQFLLRQNYNMEFLNINFTVDVPAPAGELFESLAKSRLKVFECRIFIGEKQPVNISVMNNNLKTLEITFTNTIDCDMLLFPMLKTFVNLTYLNLSDSQITDGHLVSSYIFESLVNLETIILCSCEEWVTDASFEKSTGCLKNLEFLELEYCCNLTENAIKKFQYPKLKFLNLSGCLKIADCGFTHLAQTSPLLEHLDVSETNVSDEALKSICQNLKFLRELNVFKSPAVDYSTAQDLIELCPSLRIIETGDCKGYIYNYFEKRLVEKESDLIF